LFIIHIIQGFALALYNRKARGKERYAVKVTRAVNTNPFFAGNMALLGLLIFAFLGIHMGDFWWASKFGELPVISYGKYMPFIQGFGKLYAIVIPLLYALIPIIMYLQNAG